MDVRESEVPKPEPVATEPAAPVVRRKSVVREYAEAIAIAVLLALVIRTLIVQAFTIPSGSMMDTLLVGDYILVNKFLYGAEVPFADYRLPGLREPRRGDIVVFKYPQDETRDFIKRVVAGPGEQVSIRGQDILVDGRPLVEPYVKAPDSPLPHTGQLAGCSFAYGCEPTTVPADAYFVMGDNRDDSYDSRYWGPVRRELIKGRPFLIYWSYRSDPPEQGHPQTLGSTIAGLFDVVVNFFPKTRWDRMFFIVDSRYHYPFRE